ncbi:DUF4190 domain-containing protein [Streptomyces sp. NPDC012751]|uniref:DUF4190 domain-containing protein n=1 Tax=Streptomyces sp. NPDC012751 TaxID=3364846 RepID=UPI0036C7C6E9
MSDEVPQSTPGERTAGHRSGIPGVSLDKPADPARPDQAPLGAPAADEPPARDAGPAPAPVHDQPGPATSPQVPPAPSAPADAPWAVPAEGSAPAAAAPQPDPYAPPTSPAPQPAAFAPPASAPQPNPYAPPAPSAAQPNPYAPPPQPNPYAPQPPSASFAPPAPAAPVNPFAPGAQHGGPEPVPPPPIAPDGPGQVPYGYPSHVPYPAANGYGWPGMQPAPSNGMGTASLVLGILAAVGFVAWPIALVLGILAVIFGAIGRGKAKRGEATNPGVALAGIICGAAGIVLVLGFFAFFIALYAG